MKRTPLQFKKVILMSATVALILGFQVTHAQQVDSTYTVLAPLPCIESPAVPASGSDAGSPGVTCTGGNGSLQDSVNFQSYIQYLFNLLIAIAAVMAVFMMVLGGFEYMTSDAYSKKSDGLEKFKHAIEGLILVLCSFLILRTINPSSHRYR